MKRREFTKTLFGLPLGISCGLQAAIPAAIAKPVHKPVLLVTAPGMIAADATFHLEQQLRIQTPAHWSDISEIWYRYLADDARKQAMMVYGLTTQSHFFALKEFSRGQRFNWSTGNQLRKVSIDSQWTDKQIADALKSAWGNNFTSGCLPAGEHCLTSWSMIANGQS